jgi:hypothetical protein
MYSCAVEVEDKAGYFERLVEGMHFSHDDCPRSKESEPSVGDYE